MKKIYKVFYIAIIFCVIQMSLMIFTNNSVYAKGYLENVFSDGRQFKKLQENNTKYSSANNSFGAIEEVEDELYGTIKVIGGGIFMVAIVGIMIALNIKDKTGRDIAGLKTTLIFIVILALLFVFADKIIEVLTALFESFEG